MRIGAIQRRILFFLARCDREVGGYIGSTTKAEEFGGLDLPEVERALNALIKRDLVRKVGIRHIASGVARNWVWYEKQCQRGATNPGRPLYRCTQGHDRCGEMYAGPDCPYCERRIKR